jgi:hypothetical protein
VSDPRTNLVAAHRVARLDLDRLTEHWRDPERVDRAHRVHPMPIREVSAVRGRPAGERVGDADLAVGAAMDEILACERLERAVGLEFESFGRRARLATLFGRPSVYETAPDELRRKAAFLQRSEF